jgi:hypothetical protein
MKYNLWCMWVELMSMQGHMPVPSSGIVIVWCNSKILVEHFLLLFSNNEARNQNE